MIDLYQKALETTTGIERLKLKLGITSLPADYACRTIQEFLNERETIGLAKKILFPSFYYHPGSGFNLEGCVTHISLKDRTGSLNAFVRETAFHVEGRRPLVQSLDRLDAGTSIYFPVLMNGIPFELDTRIYLIGFQEFNIPRPKQDRRPFVAYIDDFFAQPTLCPTN